MRQSTAYRSLVFPLVLPSLIALYFTARSNRIWPDIIRWADAIDGKPCTTRKQSFGFFYTYFISYPEFRSLFYYRVSIAKLFSFLRPPMPTLFITTPDIGPGLFIQHGFATIISAEKIGANCWINQQVTIGYSSKTDTPTIGNNVRILAGAIVIGDIKIADGSTVAANSVVVKDVEANCVVGGVPAVVLRRNGVRTTA